MSSFREWVELYDDELNLIQAEFCCSRGDAMQILLLMKISGDLKDLEPWEANDE